MKETSLNEEQAKIITEETARCVISISANITYITAPMIREIINSMMLKHGFEKERLQYTRIGMPFFDLNKLFENKIENIDELNTIILTHIVNEYNNVLNLIKKKEE